MLKKRIIPVLLLRQGRMVKGAQFTDYRDTGDPVSAARIYNHQYADELVFLDIEASLEERQPLLDTIEKVAEECFMPLTIGGGITSVDQVAELLAAGADKVVINSNNYRNPELIAEVAATFGEQCVVAGIDVRNENKQWKTYSHCGQQPEMTDLGEHIKQLDQLGAGEFLLQSIDHDGLREGYDLSLLDYAKTLTRKPIIIGGGAGHFMHLVDAFEHGAHGVACASIFHFADNNPLRARSYLKNKGVPVKRYK